MGLIERLKSDITYVSGLMTLVKMGKDLDPNGDLLAPDDIESHLARWPDREAIWFEGESWTAADLERRANQYANWALASGRSPGDTVALFMENCPDYIAFWIGMLKVGVKTALINTNLTDKGLAHCIEIVGAACLVINQPLAGQAETARPFFPAGFQVWSVHGGGDGLLDLDAQLAGITTDRPPRKWRADQKSGDVALYIYTSGTTGLPKAAKITHTRCLGFMRTFVPSCKITNEDRIYLTLPLYHGTGGMCGVGAALQTGAAMVLRRRFSASAFWQEAKDQRATMFVYIGELGRYLMNQPASPAERDHSMHKAFGNGMRADVWRQFVDRTGIERIVEFYGSTEGNVSFINLDGRIGAIGRIPPLLKSRMPTFLIRVDPETEEPKRDDNGFCIETDPDEPGEAIGLIDAADARRRFDGYNDDSQNTKKIVTHVFEEGDAYFRTGDLLKKDRDGYFYFVDRLGDTFRWKGENVSTNEVAEVLSAYPGIALANVYGVAVPGRDGKAGMAAITPSDQGFDVSGLYAWLADKLPEYARPVFIRLSGDAETTGTMKLRKVELVKDGFDPQICTDPVYVAAPASSAYIPLDPDLYQAIIEGKARLRHLGGDLASTEEAGAPPGD